MQLTRILGNAHTLYNITIHMQIVCNNIHYIMYTYVSNSVQRISDTLYSEQCISTSYNALTKTCTVHYTLYSVHYTVYIWLNDKSE